MIVIEPVLPERARYPGKIDLPVVIPRSPESDLAPITTPERRGSAIPFFIAVAAAALIAGLSERPPRAKKRKKRVQEPVGWTGSGLGREREGYIASKKYPGNRLYYMWVPPGKWFEDAISIPKKKLKDYQHRANITPGALHYIWAALTL